MLEEAWTFKMLLQRWTDSVLQSPS